MKPYEIMEEDVRLVWPYSDPRKKLILTRLNSSLRNPSILKISRIYEV